MRLFISKNINKKKSQNTIDIAIKCDDISQHRVAAASTAYISTISKMRFYKHLKATE